MVDTLAVLSKEQEGLERLHLRRLTLYLGHLGQTREGLLGSLSRRRERS